MSFSRTPGLERLEDVLVDAVAHRRRHVEQDELVGALDHARLEHDLLAVADLDAQLLEREEEGRLDHVDAERHARHALAGQDGLDLPRGRLEEPGLGRDRATHAHHAGQALVRRQLRRGEPVVPRRRAEVPHPGLAVAGEEAPAGELVARPLADDGARDVADVVLVEQRAGRPAPTSASARRVRPRRYVVQAAEVHPLLEIHLGVAGRLDRPVPAVLRVDRVGLPAVAFVTGAAAGLRCHLRLLAFVVNDASLLPQTCRSR